MKTKVKIWYGTLIFLFAAFSSSAQNVGINSAGATPDASAMLDLDASPGNNKGLLLPRLTTAQRNAIVSPANSLLIFNTTTDCYEGYHTSSSTWVAFGCIGCVTPPTVATAGTDQTLPCVTTVTLGGNVPIIGTGLWTVVSGTATITTPTSAISGVTGLAATGTVTLRWTITNPPCTPSFDEVVMTTTTSSCFTGCIPTASTVVVDVINPSTGETWMDRNLGASQVATAVNNAAAYGCLYEWGRYADGHEDRGSGTTTTLSATDTPGHGNFIIAASSPFDWRSTQNVNLWQGVSGINNPCPTGYRLPTETELANERLSWTTNNSAGAYGSPLKLTVGGRRDYSNAVIYVAGIVGYYWSSTVSGTSSMYLTFNGSAPDAQEVAGGNAYGYSVRCIKD